MREKDLPIDLIVGDKNPMAAEYELKRADNGLLLSVRKESR